MSPDLDFCRHWRTRRVVITKDMISFAFVKNEAQIDHILLSEILHVKEMAEAGREHCDPENTRKFSHVMQIATRPDGFNSGRIYYLSTDTKKELDDLISDLNKKVIVSRAEAEARTWFRKLQRSVRRRYESAEFQSFMALLIAAVRLLLPHILARRLNDRQLCKHSSS